jgi:hypothetical protein
MDNTEKLWFKYFQDKHTGKFKVHNTKALSKAFYKAVGHKPKADQDALGWYWKYQDLQTILTLKEKLKKVIK